MKIKIFIMLICILNLLGCSSDKEIKEQKTPSKPIEAAKVLKSTIMTRDGIELFKFGITFDDSLKIAKDNNLKFEQSEGSLYIYDSIKLNDIPIKGLKLVYSPVKSQFILSYIELTSDYAPHKDTISQLSKLDSILVGFFGKPYKPRPAIPGDDWSWDLQKRYSAEWKNKNIATSSDVFQVRESDGSAVIKGYGINITMSSGLFASRTALGDTLTKNGKRIKAKHSDWNDDICNTIGAGKIDIGMTKDQVKAAWGRPQSVNTTTNAYGAREQWVYGMKSYVYFENGTCTVIQN